MIRDAVADDAAEKEVIELMEGALGAPMGTFRMVARRTPREPHFEDEDGDVPY